MQRASAYSSGPVDRDDSKELRCRRGSPRQSRCWVVWISMTLAGTAFADEECSAWFPDSIFVQAGIAETARSVALGTSWAPFWEHPVVGGRAWVFWEASVGRWKGESDLIHQQVQWATQIGLTPVMRWQPSVNVHWFVEAGIGLNVVAPLYRRRSKRFSTAFNFGDHVGAGWRFGDAGQHEVAFRIQHFSNADIKLPNPGENFRQLRYTWGF